MRTLELPVDLVSDLRSIGLNPTDIVLYVNSGCNLRCKHCYVGTALLNASVSYSFESIMRFEESLPPLDRLTLLGGEPFLHPALLGIVAAFGRHSCKERQLTTNLTLLKESILSELETIGFRICVSLDGHTAELHDAIRGIGMFDQTTRNLRYILERSLDVEVTHTITAANIRSFWEMVSFCKSIGLRRLNLHHLSVRGNALANRHLAVTATQWRTLTDAIEARHNERDDSLIVRYEMGFVTRTELRSLFSSGKYLHHSFGSYYSPGGGHRVVIYPDSRVYVSSEAFGGDSYVGEIAQGRFKFNDSNANELIVSRNEGFDNSVIDSEIVGDERYPIPLSVSFRKTGFV